jgi:hypothetical protein
MFNTQEGIALDIFDYIACLLYMLCLLLLHGRKKREKWLRWDLHQQKEWITWL